MALTKELPEQVDDDETRAVNSYNEWDPLEEVVVGRIEESTFPPHHLYVLGGCPEKLYNLLAFIGGLKRRPKRWFVEAAQRELDEFIHILKAEGVKVKRPDVIDHGKTFSTPNWRSKGHTTACPRDCFLVVGDEIIEAPMSWRCRYFERHAYYSLFKAYFDQGARWTSAPKPPLMDSLYNEDYVVPRNVDEMQYVIDESEVVFDAADFTRCGRDIFVTRSNVTNQMGIEWMRRHLGEEYRVHEIQTLDTQPMHIDVTLVPLAPGKMMINPSYVDKKTLPSILNSWDILEAPEPVIVSGGLFNENAEMSNRWLNLNVLSLDEERVIVERSQEPTIKALKEWGMKPIPCSFLNFSSYGGAFHCTTLDVRRRGTLQSYF